jgi:hypothetical protein
MHLRSLQRSRAADSGRGDDQTGERGLYGGDQAKFLKSATLFSSAAELENAVSQWKDLLDEHTPEWIRRVEARRKAAGAGAKSAEMKTFPWDDRAPGNASICLLAVQSRAHLRAAGRPRVCLSRRTSAPLPDNLARRDRSRFEQRLAKACFMYRRQPSKSFTGSDVVWQSVKSR